MLLVEDVTATGCLLVRRGLVWRALHSGFMEKNQWKRYCLCYRWIKHFTVIIHQLVVQPQAVISWVSLFYQLTYFPNRWLQTILLSWAFRYLHQSQMQKPCLQIKIWFKVLCLKTSWIGMSVYTVLFTCLQLHKALDQYKFNECSSPLSQDLIIIKKTGNNNRLYRKTALSFHSSPVL